MLLCSLTQIHTQGDMLPPYEKKGASPWADPVKRAEMLAKKRGSKYGGKRGKKRGKFKRKRAGKASSTGSVKSSTFTFKMPRSVKSFVKKGG